jgi:hypothetical protein
MLPRRFLALTALLLALAIGWVPLAQPAQAFTLTDGVRLNAVEARLVYRINLARRSRGLASLRVVPGYTDVARRWAFVQASSQTMKHNPDMARQLVAAGGADWRTMGENVGTGFDADSLFDAYWNSPPHRANLLNPAFRYVGMGWVERPDGRGFNTQNFVSHYSTTYGRTRVPAYGGRSDARTLTATTTLGSFETGSDARITRTASSGLSSHVSIDRPNSWDNAVRFAARETVTGTGGSAGMVLRDSLQLRNATSVTIRLRASTKTGRSVSVTVSISTVFGTSVSLGKITLASGERRTVTLAIPQSGRVWRNHLTVSVPRSSLRQISYYRPNRVANVAVYDIRVNV